MSTTLLDMPTATNDRAVPLARMKMFAWLGLAAIIGLAAVLRFSNLNALGYVNHYYAAGITSMLQSGRNFFFAAAEPGGAVSIDKPPMGLWLQAFSAYFLGVNGFALLLPEILAGLASIGVVYHLVQRSFGVMAGLLAALVLAITPIVVATDRNNTIDSLLIFTLLLATWAFIKATESGRLRFLVLGAVLVGIGFNIKMLQAYLPLPALYGLYFLGTSQSLRRKVLNLALATGVLLAVSFSWAVAVDLTPADQRPYVGSSTNNSVMSLIFGYNGVERLTGMGGGGPGRGGQFPRPAGGGQFPQTGNGNGATGQFQPPNFGNGQVPRTGNGGFGNFGRGGFPGTGQPGLLRLFTPPLSKEVSWLLPFGLFSLGLLLFGVRLRWPLAAQHQALMVWGGWLVTGGVFFSIAGFFHEYYLSMLAAPLAALVGIGVARLWQMRVHRPWLALGLFILAAGATLAFQMFTAASYIASAWWLPLTAILLVIGAALLIGSLVWKLPYAPAAGFSCVMAALLITPGIWSALTMLNSSDNQSLPAAYGGQASGPARNGSLQIDPSLLNYLTANTQGVEYLMAVPSSMQGADYVIATRRPVLYLGGFSGQDQVVTAEALAQMVAKGELRYIYWGGAGGNGPGGNRGNQAGISEWITSSCTPVQGYTTASVSAGAPDGVQGGLSNGGIPGGGGRQMALTLYDCGG